MKHAVKVNMDEISDKYKNWPDMIVSLRVTSPRLLKMSLCVISITYSVLLRSS